MADGSMMPAVRHTMLPTNIEEAKIIASYIAQSGLFGCSTNTQAFALMLLADAEGLHPAIAARDYHIIEGRPSLRADAMLARFQNAGGKVEWKERTNEKVTAVFCHDQGGTCEVTWTIEDAKRIGLAGRKNWKTYPRQMLTARCISEGVRTVFPGVVVGMYASEEVQDFDKPTQPQQQPIEAEFEETPKSLSKAKSRDLYAELVDELRTAESEVECDTWEVGSQPRIQTLHPDFQSSLQEEIGAHLDLLRQAKANGTQPLQENAELVG